jgi:hypothetical protein
MPRRPRPWRRPATTPAHCACGNFSLFVENGQNLTKFSRLTWTMCVLRTLSMS